jgi:hypothetical protein
MICVYCGKETRLAAIPDCPLDHGSLCHECDMGFREHEFRQQQAALAARYFAQRTLDDRVMMRGLRIH